jgi:hypothetical protein
MLTENVPMISLRVTCHTWTKLSFLSFLKRLVPELIFSITSSAIQYSTARSLEGVHILNPNELTDHIAHMINGMTASEDRQIRMAIDLRSLATGALAVCVMRSPPH